jgi:hypothetical protein
LTTAIGAGYPRVSIVLMPFTAKDAKGSHTEIALKTDPDLLFVFHLQQFGVGKRRY